MKITTRTNLALLAILLSPLAANADSITTTFAGGNGSDGNMFDVTTAGHALNITGFDLHLDPNQDLTPVELWIKDGSYVGSELVAGDWTFLASGDVQSLSVVPDDGTPSFWDVLDFVLAANSVYGFYITTYDPQDVTPPNFQYTNGANTYADANIQIDTGVGVDYPFLEIYEPRTWNGTIYYDVIPNEPEEPEEPPVVSAVPEPGTLALLGLGLVGIAAKRRKNV